MIPTKRKDFGWTDEGVLQEPGIKTEDHKYFSSKTTHPEKYGYRFGTEKEATELGLNQTSKRITSKITAKADSKLSPAASRQIREVTQATKGHDDQLELLRKQFLIEKAEHEKAQIRLKEEEAKKREILERRMSMQSHQLEETQEQVRQMQQMLQRFVPT